MRNKYYSVWQEEGSREANINIYGDITSWEWHESNVSSYTLSKELSQLDADVINIHINSYGGEVAEGLAIYNSLKNHKAKIKTYCDGFACSIASVIFMAGDERVMYNSSLLMIHNAWTYTAGNANELRKQADDLDKITQASINTYLSEVNITEEELKLLLDNETWLTPQESLEYGFATSIINEKNNDKVSQSVKMSLKNIILKYQDMKNKDNDNNRANTQEDYEKPIEEEQQELAKNFAGSFFNALLKLKY